MRCGTSSAEWTSTCGSPRGIRARGAERLQAGARHRQPAASQRGGHRAPARWGEGVADRGAHRAAARVHAVDRTAPTAPWASWSTRRTTRRQPATRSPARSMRAASAAGTSSAGPRFSARRMSNRRGRPHGQRARRGRVGAQPCEHRQRVLFDPRSTVVSCSRMGHRSPCTCGSDRARTLEAATARHRTIADAMAGFRRYKVHRARLPKARARRGSAVRRQHHRDGARRPSRSTRTGAGMDERMLITEVEFTHPARRGRPRT